jgi:hypothetical protein
MREVIFGGVMGNFLFSFLSICITYNDYIQFLFKEEYSFQMRIDILLSLGLDNTEGQRESDLL